MTLECGPHPQIKECGPQQSLCFYANNIVTRKYKRILNQNNCIMHRPIKQRVYEDEDQVVEKVLQLLVASLHIFAS